MIQKDEREESNIGADEERFRILPYRKYLNMATNILLIISMAVGVLSYAASFLLEELDLELVMTVSLIVFILMVVTKLTVLRKPRFDKWIRDIAERQLSSNRIWYKGRTLYLNFDRNLDRNSIMDFVNEISDKSNKFTYYYSGINIDKGLIDLTVTKRSELPKMATVNKETDKAWNIIPLGEAVNHDLRKVTPVAWQLNDNIKRDDVVNTTPSTSILIAGGTGSGKSVLQQCIVGHVSRFPDNFMFIGGDVKQVEFGSLIGVSSVKKIALDINQIQQALEEARKIMYDRFTFMKESGVNNVYNLEEEVLYYNIEGKEYQFDELFPVIVDGKDSLMKSEDIYQSLEEGLEVEIDQSYQTVSRKKRLVLSKGDISTVKRSFKPKAIMIMIDEMSEVASGSDYRVVSSIEKDISSIARLGRAAGVHLVLATQRPSGNVISADLKNNIQLSVLLGMFDSGASTLVMDKDISSMSKPEIKGRGFLKSGNNILEFQSYWTEPEKDFEFNKTSTTESGEEEVSNPEREEEDQEYFDTVEELSLSDMEKSLGLPSEVEEQEDSEIEEEVDQDLQVQHDLSPETDKDYKYNEKDLETPKVEEQEAQEVQEHQETSSSKYELEASTESVEESQVKEDISKDSQADGPKKVKNLRVSLNNIDNQDTGKSKNIKLDLKNL